MWTLIHNRNKITNLLVILNPDEILVKLHYLVHLDKI
jgi:hypothetical protein